jgi:benzoyl-CoA reductase subunit C
METFEKFSKIAADPRHYLIEWKANNKRRVIACFPMYAPEEMVQAAGMLPVTMFGSDEPISLANNYLHSFLCHPVRDDFEQFLRGRLDFADGLVFSDICDQEKRIASLLRLHFKLPFFHFVRFPKMMHGAGSQEHLIREMTRLKTALENLTGSKVTDDELRRSISLFNNTRKLLAQAYQLRRDNPGAFSGDELSVVVSAAMVMPKEEYNPLLSDYLMQKRSQKVSPVDKVRLVITGNPCENLEPGISRMIEDVGGIIVDDDIFTGSRYFTSTIPEVGNPVVALAVGYLEGIACPTKYDPTKKWADHILSLAKQSRANGVVVLMPKFCEIFAFEYPHLNSLLTENGISHLLLECDHSGATAGMKTRIQAFIETLKGE